MDLIHAEQVSFDHVYLHDIDLVVGVSGYERRASYLMERLKLGNEARVVLAFDDRKTELHRPENDRIFRKLGFEFQSISGDRTVDFNRLLEVMPQKENDTLRILVDYSCMTKPWYASFIEYFSHADLPYRKVHILFSYTRSEYIEPGKSKPLKFAEPIGHGPKGMHAGKPIALVIGLGYEKSRAEYLQKAIDPQETYCFYADPSTDKRFVEKVYVNNFKLIDSLHKNHVFSYPLDDMGTTHRMLTDLCLKLRLKHRIILVPLGPKPFALLSLLTHAAYPDIEVWRVGTGKLESTYDRVPTGEPLVYSLEFSKEDEDPDHPE